MKLPIKEFMSSPVVTTTVDSDIAYVRRLMERKDISSVPVVEFRGDYLQVRGIVTRFDLTGITDEHVPVTEVMTEELRIVTPDTSATKAASLMLEHGIHHLLVMEGSRLTGMLSSMDFVRLIAEKKMEFTGSSIFL